MRRFKLYIVVMLLAFLIGIASAAAGRPTVAGAATFVREQFDGTCANNFFPC